MSSQPPRGAVVLATKHDWPTEFVFEAAVEVERLLKPHFTCLSLLPFDLSKDLFVEFFAARSPLANGSPPAFVIGYFSAHGSARALYTAGNREVFEAETAKLFEKAILILTSCLKDGQLAERIVQHSDSVRAVIGYTKEIVVPKEDAARHWLGDRFSEFQSRFCDALIQPVRSLLERGQTANDAYHDTLTRWGELARDKSFPERIRQFPGTNASRLKIWGDPSALLIV